MSTLDISGVYPPIPTPFSEDEEINYAALESNMKKWNDTKIRGYLVQGSNGEYCYLTIEERVQMVKKVINKANDRFTVFLQRKLIIISFLYHN